MCEGVSYVVESSANTFSWIAVRDNESSEEAFKRQDSFFRLSFGIRVFVRHVLARFYSIRWIRIRRSCRADT